MTVRNSLREDAVVCILAIALLITMALASMYGFKYGNVDTSVAIGSVSITKDGKNLLTIDSDENLNAHVAYLGADMTGQLVLAGAEEDTILFQLTKIAHTDGTDSSDTVTFIRMPRDGLTGDLTGPWMVYFSRPSLEINLSDWVFIKADGTASAGWRSKMNAITTQRFKLFEMSDNSWTWEKNGSALTLNSHFLLGE